MPAVRSKLKASHYKPNTLNRVQLFFLLVHIVEVWRSYKYYHKMYRLAAVHVNSSTPVLTSLMLLEGFSLDQRRRRAELLDPSV